MDRIRQWLVDHEDGDFWIPPIGHPYSVIPPSAKSQCILYTTKPQCVMQPFSHCSPDLPCGVIGRHGLPNDCDLDWLQSSCGGLPFLYVGDADPSDLLIFAWLRSHIDVSYRGLNDSLLEKFGVTLDDRITIAQSDTESAAMQFVSECVPDFAELLGPECTAILNSGCKIELECLISLATIEPIAMVNALVSASS